MNCKPGDLAVIIGQPANNKWAVGMIVEVLYAAPVERFKFPNGVPSQAGQPHSWVIRFLRPVPLAWASRRKDNVFAVCLDSKLKPLPGEIEPSAIPAPSRELEIA